MHSVRARHFVRFASFLLCFDEQRPATATAVVSSHFITEEISLKK